MENLDKIKLDYSSCSSTCNSITSTSFTSSISSSNNATIPTPTSIDESTIMQIIQTQIVRNQQLWSSSSSKTNSANCEMPNKSNKFNFHNNSLVTGKLSNHILDSFFAFDDCSKFNNKIMCSILRAIIIFSFS